MGKLTEDLKNKLKASGRWPEFTARREELKAQGYSGKEAQRIVCDEFFDNPPKVTGRSGSYVDPDRDPEDFPVTDLQIAASEKIKKEVSSGFGAPTVKGGPLSLLPALVLSDEDQVAFEGKQAPEVEVIRWVARNLMTPYPDASKCPDAIAWGLLVHCRSNSYTANEFWKTTYTRLLPSKTQLEAMKGEKDSDGSKATEVIDELLAISKEAKTVCGLGL